MLQDRGAQLDGTALADRRRMPPRKPARTEDDDDGVLAGACLLLVEDDPKSAKLTRLALAASRCNVQCVENASAAALLLLAGLRPTAILLDLHLPGASGIELARFLEATPELAPIPVIALTASGPGFSRAAARAAGCDAYVPKPIDVGTLAAAIAATIGGHS